MHPQALVERLYVLITQQIDGRQSLEVGKYPLRELRSDPLLPVSRQNLQERNKSRLHMVGYRGYEPNYLLCFAVYSQYNKVTILEDLQVPLRCMRRLPTFAPPPRSCAEVMSSVVVV